MAYKYHSHALVHRGMNLRPDNLINDNTTYNIQHTYNQQLQHQLTIPKIQCSKHWQNLINKTIKSCILYYYTLSMLQFVLGQGILLIVEIYM